MKKIVKPALSLVWQHIISIVLSLFLMYAFSWLINLKYGTVIFTLITTWVYVGLVFSVGWNLGAKDSRNIEGFYPDINKSICIGLLGSSVSVIVFIFRVVSPYAFGGAVTEWAELIYRGWFLPCISIFGDGSNFAVYVSVLFIIPVFEILGYIVGLKKFSILEKVYPVILYKNKKKK